MKNTSLCYIKHNGKYLMLHRVVKKNDANKDKWIGIGGKFEDYESPHDCALREISEETGLNLQADDLEYRGIVTFVSDIYETEYMHLFTADLTDCRGDIISGIPERNDEGLLEWVEINKVPELPLWEGDRIFLELLKTDRSFFSLKLKYSGDALADSVLYK